MKILTGKSEKHLRSSTIGTTFPCLFAFLSDISSRCVGARPATTTLGVIWPVSRIIDVFHRLIPIISISVRRDSGNSIRHIDVFPLEQLVHQGAQLKISWAEEAWVTLRRLRFGLQPEEVPLGARGELQHVYSTISQRPRLVRRGTRIWRLIRREVAIRWYHDQVKLWRVHRC